MKALTLWRPWDVLIARGIKRIENRKWSPGSRLVQGERFAIHSGLKFDTSCIPFAQSRGVEIGTFDPMLPAGHVCAVATYVGLVSSAQMIVRQPALLDPWFMGPYGWLLEDVVLLPQPVPCRGGQKLWDLPPAVSALVRAQLERQAA